MKTLRTRGVQAFELMTLCLMLLLAPAARGQERTTRQASDAEVAAGSDVKAYVNPRQLQNSGGGGGGNTNGLTPAQSTNAINNLAILQQSGTGTNTTLGTLTVLQGKYKDYYLADGTYLRSNSIPPLDWESYTTNGIKKTGTNFVTRSILNNGTLTLQGNLNANGINGNLLTASSVLASDAAKNVTNIVNGSGALTNDGSGGVGWLSLSSFGGGGGSQTPWTSDIDGGGFSLTNVSTLRTTTATVTTLNATNMAGNGWGLTNLNIFDTPTNAWSGTAFWLGTNSVIKTASDVGIVSIINTPATGTERFGQLVIVAGADITVTNLIPGVHASDNAFSRVCTNGNTMTIAIDMILGVCTNMFIVQCH